MNNDEDELILSKRDYNYLIQGHSLTSGLFLHKEDTITEFIKRKNIELPTPYEFKKTFKIINTEKKEEIELNIDAYKKIWEGSALLPDVLLDLKNFYVEKKLLTDNINEFLTSEPFELNSLVQNRMKLIKNIPIDISIPKYVGRVKLTSPSYLYRVGLTYLLLYKELYPHLKAQFEQPKFPTTNHIILKPFSDILWSMMSVRFEDAELRDFAHKKLDR